MRVAFLSVGAAVALTVCACKENPGAPGGDADQADAPPAWRQGTHVVRSLIRESGRAELRAGGLFIDLGTPDQYKYLQRHVTSGWGGSRNEAGIDLIEIGHNARLALHERRKVTHVLIRARLSSPRGAAASPSSRPAAARSQLCLRLDSEPLPCRRLGAKWQVLSFPVKPALGPVVRSLALLVTTPLQVDWIWLNGRGGQQPPAERAVVRSYGAQKRALAADPPRSYSYHLRVPPGTALAFDYGARYPTRFTVELTRDRHGTKRLFSATSGTSWRQAGVDLKDFAGQIVRLDLITEAADRRGGAGWGAPALVRRGPPPGLPPLAAKDQPQNVVHIVLDACRWDALQVLNPGSPVKMPALGALAKRAVVFTNAYASASWTIPSASSFLGASYPKGGRRYGGAPPLLPGHLQRHGFRTAYFAATPPPATRTNPEHGWSHIHARPELDAGQLYGEALSWLQTKRGDARFLLQIQPAEAREPYRSEQELEAVYLAAPYRGKLPRVVTSKVFDAIYTGSAMLKGDDIRYLRSMYHQGLHRHDVALARFLEGLKRLGLLDETLVVFTSNHGQELFDHGRLGHGRTLYEEVVRVPLLLHYPKLFPRQIRVDEIVELVDVVPTELELLGLPPLRGTHGVSLRGVIAGDPPAVPVDYALFIDTEIGVRVGEVKLIRSWMTQEPTRERLYLLADDPEERWDRRLARPVALRLAQTLLGEGFAVPDKGLRLSAMQDGPAPGGPAAARDAKRGR